MEQMRALMVGPRSVEAAASATSRYFLPSPPPSSTLCATCARLNFRLILSESLEYNFLTLGLFPALLDKSASCSFCRLVVAAVRRELSGILPRWEELAPDGELAAMECGLSTAGPGTFLIVNVYPMPSAVVATKTDTGKVERMWIDVLGEDVGVLGLEGGVMFRPRDVKGEFADIERLKTWVKLCEKLHAEDCGADIEESKGKVPDCLRVIDVKRMRLVPVVKTGRFRRKKQPKSFVALSYVWGGTATVEQYRTTKANFARRKRIAGLRGVPFPRTIADSIKLVALLGMRYLWVDAVCIIQDDNKDQEAQISSMAYVYGAAHSTIVGAGGGSADAGLPRAHRDAPGKELDQVIETVAGARLVLPPPRLRELETHDYRPAWFTRGWTYQERLLSSRVLYFTPGQVCFQCRCCTFYEDTVAEQDPPTQNPPVWLGSSNRFKAVITRPSQGPNQYRFLQAFKGHVEEYSTRFLSYDSDAINAFFGVGTALIASYRLPNQNLAFGLPEYEFANSLLWQPELDHTRRDTGASGVFLPSWSWAGWKGKTKYSPHTKSDWMSIHGSSEIVHHTVSEWTLHISSTESRRIEMKRLRYDGPTFGRGQHEKPYSDPPPPPSPLPRPEHPPATYPGVLEFVTTSARFQLRSSESQHHSRKCGCFRYGLKARPQARYVHHLIGADSKRAAGCVFLSPESVASKGLCETPGEFICIGRSGAGDIPCPGYDEEVYERAGHCLFDVMLVEWKDGIAERVALGTVHEDAWVAAGPEWKRIYLG